MFKNIDNLIVQQGDWQALSSGTSNQLYTAVVSGVGYVLRINAGNQFAYGVDRLREQSVLKYISRYEWSPTIIENNVDQGWCLMLHHGNASLEGEGIGLKLMQHIIQLQSSAFVENHGASHGLSPDENLSGAFGIPYQSLLLEYFELFNTSNVPDPVKTLTQAVLQKIGMLPPVKMAVVHHDLHRGNVCLQQTKEGVELVIIDWEYAGWGSPWFDIAALHCEFGVSKELLQQMPIFKGLTMAEFEQGLIQSQWLNNSLENLWYWARAVLARDYDDRDCEFQALLNATLLHSAC